jgi:hypothetical protein
MHDIPSCHRTHLRPDAVIDRPAESSGDMSRIKADMPCCDLSLELTDEAGVIMQAGCPRCQLAYTVELCNVDGAQRARFTVIGPIAIASPRPAAGVTAEGLTWHPLGRRTHLVSAGNAIIGVVTRDKSGNSFTARRYGVTDKLPRMFVTVEAAARALWDAR